MWVHSARSHLYLIHNQGLCTCSGLLLLLGLQVPEVVDSVSDRSGLSLVREAGSLIQDWLGILPKGVRVACRGSRKVCATVVQLVWTRSPRDRLLGGAEFSR